MAHSRLGMGERHASVANKQPVGRSAGATSVRDGNGQHLAHVYADNRQIVNTLTEDEARRIASNIARLPPLLRRDLA